jgi:hypothetical protein
MPRHCGPFTGLYVTHSLSWAILEKPPIVQLLKNFPAFYGTRKFISVFTRALHWSLAWARLIQPSPCHSTHLRLGLPSGLFSSGFPTNILYAFLFSPFVLHISPIASCLTWSSELYLTKSISYDAPHYVYFLQPPVNLSSIQIFSPAPCRYKIIQEQKHSLV